MSEHRIEVDDGGGRSVSVPVNLPGNSKYHKDKDAPPKEEREKIQPVVTGEVIQRKKGAWKRAKSAMFSEETHGVWQYVMMDVLVPAAKSMLLDAVSQGFERVLYGDTRLRSRADRPGGYVPYNRVRREPPRYATITTTARARHDFDEVILETRGEAEDVLVGLRDLINQFEVATVSDFYDLCGITGSYPDQKWGWTDLTSALVRPVRGGYLISLPRPRPID
jgi:hypothetical protein